MDCSGKDSNEKFLHFFVPLETEDTIDELALIVLLKLRCDGEFTSIRRVTMNEEVRASIRVKFPSLNEKGDAWAAYRTYTDADGCLQASTSGALDRADPQRAQAQDLLAEVMAAKQN